MERFPAVVVNGPGPAALVELGEDDLPDEAVTVEVAASSLNYKDCLAVTAKGKVVRSFPMTCGIDLAGTVSSVTAADGYEPGSPRGDGAGVAPGDEVLVTGCGLGEEHPGGFTTRQRVRPEWIVPLPDGLDHTRAMALGTAGFTAMLSVMALERQGLQPSDDAEVLVTGAGGGVGSVSVALLSRLGYRVVASTGRPQLDGYLRGLGAAEIADRAELAAGTSRPLSKERWAGVVDTVGSTTLASAISQARRGSAVAACGLAGGSDLPATVLPFILRGVHLAGIDSVWCRPEHRREAWQRLAALLPAEVIDGFSEVRPMSEVFELSEAVLSGVVRGRIVIDPAR